MKDWHDEDSWQEFSKIYQRLIFDSALRAGLTNVEAEEVLQDTLLSVAKKIAGFNYDSNAGSFRNWLLQITKRRIVDQFRKRRPQTHYTADVGSTLEQIPDPGAQGFEALWNEEWHLALLDMARAFVKRKVGARQYRMFELYVLQQQPIRVVTKTLRVNAAQVYMAKYRITQLLKREMKQLQKDTL
ncbi:MAG TPA: sigma-70 family RNA polymerase sigma factor [Candidatus Binatia bacterium]|nr:sigma-70 family RNA polymerase sigma factor [Candidatus Binatia bacterium]